MLRIPRGQSSSAPQFLGLFSVLVHFNTDQPSSARSHMGREVFLGVSHASRPQGVEPQHSQLFLGSLFMFTPFNIERPNSAW